ncbi:MAG: 30S ribosomal protein S2, partial [Pseudomonadota bacterium]
YCNLVADAVIDGISASEASLGVDVGAMEEAPPEPALSAEEPASEGSAEAGGSDDGGADTAANASQETEPASA